MTRCMRCNGNAVREWTGEVWCPHCGSTAVAALPNPARLRRGRPPGAGIGGPMRNSQHGIATSAKTNSAESFNVRVMDTSTDLTAVVESEWQATLVLQPGAAEETASGAMKMLRTKRGRGAPPGSNRDNMHA